MTPIVPTDSTSIYAALSTLSFKDQRLALVRPQNPPVGVAGYLIDVVDEDSVDLTSDITDHYLEDNTAVQDQIALHPETVTVRGTVVEISLLDPQLAGSQTSALNGPPSQEQLPQVIDLTPELAPAWDEKQAETEDNLAKQKQRIVDANSLYGYYLTNVTQEADQTKQSKAFGYFYQLWKGRQTFSVETPWGFFNSMAIQSLSFRQGATTKYASEIAITFKKIHVAKAIDLVLGQLAGRATFQQTPIAQNSNVATKSLGLIEVSKYLQRVSPTATP